MNDMILYTSEDSRTHTQSRAQAGSIWLTEAEIAELFQTIKQNVSLHAKNIFQDHELAAGSVVKESLTVGIGQLEA